MNPQFKIHCALVAFAISLLGLGCTRGGQNTPSVEGTSHALTQAAPPTSGEPVTGQAAPVVAQAVPIVDLVACRACQVRTQVCSCDEQCLKCLYGKVTDGSCRSGLAYYHEACACLQQNCGQQCPTACDR